MEHTTAKPDEVPATPAATTIAEPGARLMESAQNLSAAQQKLLRAASRLLQILRGPGDGSAVEALVKLLRPLYGDYARIARGTHDGRPPDAPPKHEDQRRKN